MYAIEVYVDVCVLELMYKRDSIKGTVFPFNFIILDRVSFIDSHSFKSIWETDKGCKLRDCVYDICSVSTFQLNAGDIEKEFCVRVCVWEDGVQNWHFYVAVNHLELESFEMKISPSHSTESERKQQQQQQNILWALTDAAKIQVAKV